MQKNRDKRERLLTTALHTIYQQGFTRTSLADIAKAAKVPLGNVYYYFKTKQALVEAIVDRRAEFYAKLLDDWDELPDPRQRLVAFIDMTVEHKRDLVESGCPIGTLCTELQKGGRWAHGGALAERTSRLFEDVLAWLDMQFSLLDSDLNAPDLAIQLLSSLEGATLLSHSFRDSEFIEKETTRLKKWVTEL